MAQEQEATTVSVIVGVHASTTPQVTANIGPDRAMNVTFAGRGVVLTGSPEDQLAFARALVAEVERAVPVDLLLADWATEEAAL